MSDDKVFCGQCKYFKAREYKNDGWCSFTIPANLAAKLELNDQYELEDALTDHRWSCNLGVKSNE